MIVQTTFRFYAELNDHLAAPKRAIAFPYTFDVPITVAQALAIFLVPQDEVDLVLINGEPASLERQLADGDYVSVYPVWESFDLGTTSTVRPSPLRQISFVLDVQLGKLARHLRLLGFDTLYQNDYTPSVLRKIVSQEHRTLLTMSRRLLNQPEITRGFWIHTTEPRRQLDEVLARFDLYRLVLPFSRCLCCNGLLLCVKKEAIIQRLEPCTKKHFDQFQLCPGCDRLYWLGSHYDRLANLVNEVLASPLRVDVRSNHL